MITNQYAYNGDGQRVSIVDSEGDEEADLGRREHSAGDGRQQRDAGGLYLGTSRTATWSISAAAARRRLFCSTR